MGKLSSFLTFLCSCFKQKKDADEVHRVCNTRSGQSITFYAISKLWMTSFLEYIHDNEHLRPSIISNSHLVEKLAAIRAIPVEDESSNADDDLFGHNDMQIIGSETASSNVPVLQNALKQGLVAGTDYVLVGESVWTLLSLKFGYDEVLEFQSRLLSADEKQKWSDKSAEMSDLAILVYENTSLADSYVAVPVSGHFDYALPEKNPLSQLISDYGEANDMVSRFNRHD